MQLDIPIDQQIIKEEPDWTHLLRWIKENGDTASLKV